MCCALANLLKQINRHFAPSATGRMSSGLRKAKGMLKQACTDYDYDRNGMAHGEMFEKSYAQTVQACEA